MRYTQAEKLEIIRAVEESDLPVRRTLAQLQVSRSSFYRWYRVYARYGAAGLARQRSSRRQFWNRIPDIERERVVEIALEKPDLSARQLAWHITDTEGWFYLSTILDDYSRYIVSWKLRTSMSAGDVTATLDDALAVAGVDQVKVRHRPRLLSDNGSCYISHELAEYLQEKQMDHTRGKPYHPQTQGKIERYHRTMKNVVKLQNYYQSEVLEREIGLFVDYYNNKRVHESLGNVTPADVYCGRHRQILEARRLLKMQTLRRRRCYNNGCDPGEEEPIRPSAIREGVL